MPFFFPCFPSVYTIYCFWFGLGRAYIARGVEDYHRVITIFSISVVGVLFLGRGTVCYVLRVLKTSIS